MNDVRTLLERGYADATPPPDGFERMLRRRDRKRRNQRIAAGVVGIAVFVAAVWVVTTGPFQSQTEVVPGGAGTGSGETGPIETGPTETGPEPTAPPEAGWDGQGLPPEGTAPSTPEEGELIAHFFEPYGPIFVYVYADGRVITQERGDGYGFLPERRLTPEGTELVRTGDIPAEDFRGSDDRPYSGYDVPADVWEDTEIKPFVPSRYAVCYWTDQGATSYDKQGYEDPSRVVGFFPAPARDILRGELTIGAIGTDDDLDPQVCSEVTTEEARALDEILGWTPMPGGPVSTGGVRVEDSEGNEVYWEPQAILPHGVAVGYCSPNPCG